MKHKDAGVPQPTDNGCGFVLRESKLRVPKVAPHHVRRGHTIDKLNNGAQENLATVIAPAGYGKTTAVGQWLNEMDKSAGWVTLDVTDNDPDVFWLYVSAAMAHVCKEKDTQHLLAGPNTNSFAACLHRVNELANQAGEFIIALDNYHVIKNQSIVENIEELIGNMPDNMYLVVISRIQFQLSRLQLGFKQPTVIRAEDLRFSQEETYALCLQHGICLTPDEQKLVHERTEGWVAPLMLSASYAQTLDVDGLLQSLQGDKPPVSVYIDSEFFSSLPKHVGKMLLSASILSSLTASLLADVCEIDDNGSLLEAFDAARPYLIPLNSNKGWYRLHSLFREYLQHKLHLEQKHQLPQLHRRAGKWYEKSSLTREAIAHYFNAGESARALSLLEKTATGDVREFSDLSDLLMDMESFPREMVESSPILCLTAAWYMAMGGREEEAQSWLTKSEESLKPVSGQNVQTQNETELIKIYLLLKQKNINLALEKLTEICTQMDRESIFKNYAISLNRGDPTLLPGPYGLFGRLKQIGRINDDLIEHLIRIGLPAGYLRVVRAELLYEFNDQNSASELLMQVLTDALQEGILSELVPAFFLLAKIRINQGKVKGAFQVIAEGEKRAQAEGNLHFLNLLRAFKVRLQIHINDHEPIDNWLQNKAPNFYDKINPDREYEYITLARVLRFHQNPQDAILILKRLLVLTQREDRLPSSIEILNLQALAYDEMGETSKAFDSLCQALTLGRTEGYIRSFLDEGQPMVDLLNKLNRKYSSSEMLPYVRSLLRQVRTDYRNQKSPVQRNHATASESFLPLEPLSTREIEILRLLAQGASNAEIAEKLSITLNTVKVHNRNLFYKLNVKNRTMAVKQANEAGIL